MIKKLNFILALLSASLCLHSAILAEEPVLPRYLTAQEKEAMNEPAGPSDVYLWECFDLAGFTDPPPSSARFPTESEQTRGAMYGWPSYGAQMPELTELIRNSVQQEGYETTVLVPDGLRNSAETTLRNRGFDDMMIARINWFFTPLNGIWIRDYGAEPLFDSDGSTRFIDMGYYSGPRSKCPATPEGFTDLVGRPIGRPSDDVSPTRFGPHFLDGVDVFRPQLRTEGGNLQTDGRGTCVHMRRDVLRQNQFSRWRYDQETLDQVYSDYFNCSRVITLESLVRDPAPRCQGIFPPFWCSVIDHVDMFAMFISPETVVVARLDPEDAKLDPDNAAILDRNAQTLMDAGYNVIRIPQPARYCTLHRNNTCIAQPGDTGECDVGYDRVWATYANMMRIGNRMLVPIYRDPVSDKSPLPKEVKDRIMRQEAESLATIQSALDTEFKGAVQVVPVVSDAMIPCEGSVHCITMTY